VSIAPKISVNVPLMLIAIYQARGGLRSTMPLTLR